jgi:DNA-binding PadR family transcriptional regulator
MQAMAFGGRRHGRGGMDWDGEDRPGRRGRRVDGGELRLVLLKLIGDQPRHGYDLIRAIEELTGGAYAPSPGVIYPTLTLLADMDFVHEQDTDGARKQFAITPAGEAHLAEHADDVAAILARLGALADAGGRQGAAPLRRAIHNLRNVLEHKLAAGADKATIEAAVELIDEAARKIERL